MSILRVAPVPESEFLNYCGLRQKHSAVIDKLEFAKTLKFDDDRKVIYQVTNWPKAARPSRLSSGGKRPGYNERILGWIQI